MARAGRFEESTTSVCCDADRRPNGPLAPVPGLVVIFAGGRAAARVFGYEGRPIAFGRRELGKEDEHDSSISRQHARFTFDGGAWTVADLGSRNGTFVNGCPVADPVQAPFGSVVRIGGALVLAVADVWPFRQHGVGVRAGIVGGPAMRGALERIALVRRGGDVESLLITGESGTGKEIAARAFHGPGQDAEGPFVGVNCATIPKELAERLLFGAQRGAFSGATDAPGYVQTAHGGTLFLDEIAELAPDVQCKLLRLVETREVMRLGASRYTRVDVRVCAATWKDLRAEVGAGRFREDLFFRIAQADVVLPPLRDRIEEIPWHVEQALGEVAAGRTLGVTAAFVEACTRRAWPGNVRELRAEVRRASTEALASDATSLTAADLGAKAGRPIPRTTEAPAASFPEDEVAAALAEAHGNVTVAARRLGVHRNKVRRWLERHDLDARRFKACAKERHS